MNYKEKYQQWLNFDEKTRHELLNIHDEKEIEDCFYKDLSFGTGGLRGVMGAGSNRMNQYTVQKATLGLAHYINSMHEKKKSIVIAYDTRNHSKEFAEAAASVLCAEGIKVYLFEDVMPTPVLSFAVRYFKASAGIVITASHNPKEYNGYKVYNQYGGQLVPSEADHVIRYIEKIQDFSSIPTADLAECESSDSLVWIGEKVLDCFIQEVAKQSIDQNHSKNLKVVYTPLHGTGNIPVRKALDNFSVSVVKEQELPDGDFSTVRSPNPEERDALNLAIQQAKKEKADIVIGTDPDCDRIGVAVRHEDQYILLTGNQIGALLVDFVLSSKEVNEKSTLIKTIVTNDLGAEVALDHGLHVLNTLTGFKYIGEKMTEFNHNQTQEFVMGYEESYGYLVGTHARDKDAVVAARVICEMASVYKANKETLIDRIEKLYSKYGFYLDALDSFVLKGKDGAEKIQMLMAQLREQQNSFIPSTKAVLDYSSGIDSLPKENVLKFILLDDSWVAVRPSGTEPKIKVYYSIKEKDKVKAQHKLDQIREKFESLIVGVKETISV
ncbi:phospho-sugar mutase [Pisciglobus halotolerans]|uniref:phosphoglucomutase (alpha-D-glucose-1,6-bisphosphate-dependent) n=1 Tax=Pisciglobus halotolerans TaxID=745365 RepID=A0A1I3DLJ4_9LACT|nr:phospho-sugar mutase [Pisciglobus halotolerans]SFH87595.1 phosphoglucomutase [Pisciglobus halotolerans]